MFRDLPSSSFSAVPAIVLSLLFGLHVDARASELTPPAQSHVFRFFEDGGTLYADEPFPLGLTESFVFEVWIRVEAFPRQGVQVLSLVTDDGGDYLGGLDLGPEGQLGVNVPGSGVSGPSAELGVWTHVAVRGTSTDLSLLVDGSVVAEGPGASFSIPSARVGLGALRGMLRQARLWGVALGDAEIRALAETPPEPGDPRLIAWWPLDDPAVDGLSKSRVRDLGPNGFHLRSYTTDVVSPVGRWVRPEVVEAGPYFERRSLVPEGGEGVDRRFITSVTGLPNPRFIDYDQDGDLDVYTISRLDNLCSTSYPYFEGEAPQPDRVFRNDGSGPLVEVSGGVLQGDRIQGFLVHDFLVADFSGDGTKDIFVTENGPECNGNRIEDTAYPNSFRLGSPAGVLDNQTLDRVPQVFATDHRSAFGDIDGDGDLDVVSASFESRPSHNLVYINDGDGFFTFEPERVQQSRSLTSVAILDADLDGDLDLFLGDNVSKDGRNALMLNDGTGNFTEAPGDWLPPKELGPGIVTVHTMVPADLNGDGILDLIASEQRDGRFDSTDGPPFLQLLLGNGDGSFRDASERLPQDWGVWEQSSSFGSAIFYLESFDQNADGWPDLVIPSVGPTLPKLLINRGSEGFEEAGDLIGDAGFYAYVNTGDIESDGDQDLVFELELFENVKPYSPNPFPQADLSTQIFLSRSDGELDETVIVTNTGPQAARTVQLNVPLPARAGAASVNAASGTCRATTTLVSCELSALETGAAWQVTVTSPAPAGDPASRFAVASVTGDVIDPDRTNNLDRVPLSQIQAPPCVAGPQTACLLEGRFAVRGVMKDFASPPNDFPTEVVTFAGERAETADAAFFESFSPGNFEIGVKVLDACAIRSEESPTGNYWVFAGGLTNARAHVDVVDTVTGEEWSWDNPVNTLAVTVGDTAAFVCSDGEPAEPCVPDDQTACLGNGRFRVSGWMEDFDSPPSRFPLSVMTFPGGRAESREAVFWESFSPGNFEVGVKVLDACSFPQGSPARAYWAFYGGLTNAATEIRVTQVSTGLVDVWNNPAGSFPQAVARTSAFPCEP